MELSSDFIAIQRILSSVVKDNRELLKISYRGGNEEKILQILVEIQKFLANKDYLKDGKPNKDYSKQLEDLVFFLAINTNFKNHLEEEQIQNGHLMGIIPQLSKCLFANIVYGLDLIEYYCITIEKLPIKFGIELLEEALQCLKKSTPNICLNYSYMFLETTAKKLEVTVYTTMVQDDVDNLVHVTNIILHNLTGLYSDQTKNMRSSQIYEHMGYCLLNLLNLLLICNRDIIIMSKFILNIIRTCSSVMMNVTVDVFCAWAEIKEEDEILQIVISGKAYVVIQKYHKYPDAKELTNMLGSIARKPKTIMEKIHEADIATKIKKIDMMDGDQQKWFKALLSSFDIAENEEALECLQKWSNLCDVEDVTELLNIFVKTNKQEVKNIVIKSAATLPLEKLDVVCRKHFYKNKFGHVLADNVEANVTIIFNKLNKDEMDKHLVKEILFQMLQNPNKVFLSLYIECVKSAFLTNCLMECFSFIKEIASIDGIGIKILSDIMEKTELWHNDVKNVVELIKVLLKVKYFSHETVWQKLIYPLIKKFYVEQNYEMLNCGLLLASEGQVRIYIQNDSKAGVEYLFEIMVESRCNFLTFNGQKHKVVGNVVDILLNQCDIDTEEVTLSFKKEDGFTNYYETLLTMDRSASFFQILCPNFDFSNHGKCVANLIQVLPTCVTREWLMMTEGLVMSVGYEKCMELFTDVMILLSELVESQSSKETSELMIYALKHCIQNYGIIMQKLQNKSTIEVEQDVAKQISRLLSKLPNVIKEEEGLSLINIFTDRCLKELGKDKDFLCRLVLIKNANICKTLAHRIRN